MLKALRAGLGCPPEGKSWAVNGPRGLVKRPQMLKSIMMACTRDTLALPNLSHMDFPDGPAAIH